MKLNFNSDIKQKISFFFWAQYLSQYPCLSENYLSDSHTGPTTTHSTTNKQMYTGIYIQGNNFKHPTYNTHPRQTKWRNKFTGHRHKDKST